MKPFALGNLAIGGMFFAALIAPAHAADMVPLYKVPPAAVSWSGCYLGGDAGAAWSSQDVSNSAPLGLDQAGVVGTINGAGAIVGGYGGCNLQWSPAWVIGIEGDFSGAHLGGTANAANLFASGAAAPTGGIAWTGHLDSVATVRARVGYVWTPNVLFFLTGGAAWGRSSYNASDVFAVGCPACATATFNATSSGYVVGGGVDWAVWNNNWIVRMEYLYHSLAGASASAVFQPPLTGVAASPAWKDVVVQTARLGLSYKF